MYCYLKAKDINKLPYLLPAPVFMSSFPAHPFTSGKLVKGPALGWKGGRDSHSLPLLDPGPALQPVGWILPIPSVNDADKLPGNNIISFPAYISLSITSQFLVPDDFPSF